MRTADPLLERLMERLPAAGAKAEVAVDGIAMKASAAAAQRQRQTAERSIFAQQARGYGKKIQPYTIGFDHTFRRRASGVAYHPHSPSDNFYSCESVA